MGDGVKGITEVQEDNSHCIICKLAEGAFCPIIQFISEYVEQHRSQ